MTGGRACAEPGPAMADLAAALQSTPGLRDIALFGALAPHTTWRVGGPADLLCVAETVDGLIAAARAAMGRGLLWRVLGRGSNVLVSDQGVEGLVILNRSASLSVQDLTARADAGLLLSVLARRTAAAGLAGLEWCAGIPGSVGGALVSNAGAHGGSMSDTLRHVQMLDRHGAVRWEPASWLGLAYRHSRLRDTAQPEEVVLGAEFELRRDVQPHGGAEATSSGDPATVERQRGFSVQEPAGRERGAHHRPGWAERHVHRWGHSLPAPC
jgi:UDP-N-acetylenolpyruvoylglucosamine reductase